MDKSNGTMAEQVGQAATAFERERTGHGPKSVTVLLSDDTLVVTMHGALSAGEQALVCTPEGAPHVREFYRQLFANASGAFRQEIKRITGVAVHEATAEIETTTGIVAKVFTTGTVVQVFLLSGSVPPDTWSGNGPSDQSGQVVL